MLLFASTLDNVCVLTRAMSALRTVSMNRLPAPEMVPLPHSDDDDDEAADDLVSSEPRPPLAPPVPALVPPLPPSLCPRKSLVLSFSSSHSECNKDVRVLNWKHHTDISKKKVIVLYYKSTHDRQHVAFIHVAKLTSNLANLWAL